MAHSGTHTQTVMCVCVCMGLSVYLCGLQRATLCVQHARLLPSLLSSPLPLPVPLLTSPPPLPFFFINIKTAKKHRRTKVKSRAKACQLEACVEGRRGGVGEGRVGTCCTALLAACCNQSHGSFSISIARLLLPMLLLAAPCVPPLPPPLARLLITAEINVVIPN